MYNFKIDDKVIFTWSFTEYPGIIKGVSNTLGDVYIVEFSPDSYAGSYESIRNIHSMYLKYVEIKKDSLCNNKNKIIIKI